jgi:hypothetical protein
MFENLSIGIVTFLEVVLGPVLLAAGLLYGIMMYRKRSQAARRVTEEQTRALYDRSARQERQQEQERQQRRAMSR